jgi:hypothetical protein
MTALVANLWAIKCPFARHERHVWELWLCWLVPWAQSAE